MWQHFMAGLFDLMSIQNFIFINIGMFVGIVFGAVPGLSAQIGIMLMLPMTFSMNPTSGILMLMAIYCGGMYGGSITAILIGIPGTNIAIATMFDGITLAKQGKANKALSMALVASTIGGIASAFALLFTAPFLSELALKIGPPEYFALAIFGLSVIAGISGDSLLRGLFACCLGYVTAIVGIDSSSGAERFVFDNIYLLRGLGLVPILLGIFALPFILEKVLDKEYQSTIKSAVIAQGKDKLEMSEIRACAPVLVKSTLLGIIIGAIPGPGAAIASFIAYNEAKRGSKHPERFGKGALEGIAAPESASNGVTAASFIPLFTLGIPGTMVAAALIGAFTIHGMQVGPTLFRTQGPLMYSIMIGLIFANIFMFIQGKYLSRVFANIVKVPQIILIPSLLIFCIAGAFTNTNNMFDVYIMLVFTIIMYFLGKLSIPFPPYVLGIILGPMAESNLRRSLVMSEGSWIIFLIRPICLVILVITVLFTAYSIKKIRQETKAIAAAKADVKKDEKSEEGEK